MEIYLVGGAVRDELLGLPVKERDWVVVGSNEQQMLEQGFQKVGKDFPVFLHPETHEEYALARTERKTGSGYYGFTCYSSPDVTLEEDLKRRDLTINAMAKAADGKIIDPFGGQNDLQARILRHVSSAFAEDPVRILRVARFSARFANLGFNVAAKTEKLMASMVAANEVDALVPERVWQEMQRALTEAKPTVFLQVLKQCGALARIFPELDKLWGIPQGAKCHPEIDTGVHVILALDMACKLIQTPKIRFAVMLHDIGKSLTPKEQWPDHPGHEEAGVAIVKEWCKKYRVPSEYRNFAMHFARWHMHSHIVFKLTGADIMQMFNAMDVFRNEHILSEFLIAAESDHRGRQGTQDLPYPQADFLRQAFAVAQQISAKQFRELGLHGEELGRQIQQARIDAINELLRQQAQGLSMQA
jgi:tRNA nucleotidyltransferase (CCA-adding enzyme)